jgi:hypothetical protein
LFLFLETKTLHKISLVCPYEKKKPKRNLQKFRNIHSNSSTSPSHRHEGFGEIYKKFRNIHSNSSTSPSHRHEGFGEIYKNFAIFTVTVPLVLPTGTKDSRTKSQTSPPESSGNKPGRASDLCYRTFFYETPKRITIRPSHSKFQALQLKNCSKTIN